MPKVTTPAVGALGFTKSDAAPETPTTRAFASLVTSGMSAPVGAMAGSSEAGDFWSDFMTRAGGVLSAAGGAAESVLGGMLFGGSAVATFGSGGTAAGLGIPGMIGGAALGAHGIDEFFAGIQTAWDGTVHRPYTAQGLDAVTGNPGASDWINAAGGMIGSAGAGAALKSLKAAAQVGKAAIPAFTSSTIDDVVASAARPRSLQIAEGARAIAKKLGHAEKGGYTSAFQGIAPTQANAESLIRSIMSNPERIFYGNKVIDVYNAAGQGVRIEAGSRSFQGFIEGALSTQ
jgi:hypothetical protein